MSRAPVHVPAWASCGPSDGTGRIVRAFFPFGGIVEGYLTYDRISFALWPLYIHSRRGQIHAPVNFLFPIFKYGSGSQGPHLPHSGRLFGRSYREGSYDSRFYLWPFFHLHRGATVGARTTNNTPGCCGRWSDGLGRGSSARPRFLWPFFGYVQQSRSRASGPGTVRGRFVRILRPGEEGRPSPHALLADCGPTTRGTGWRSTWYLWPFFNLATRKTYAPAARASPSTSLPLWQHWEREHEMAERHRVEQALAALPEQVRLRATSASPSRP